MADKEKDSKVNEEFEEGGALILNRSDFLNGETLDIQGLDEKELSQFFREIAGDNNIVGLAFSSIRLGGIYTHVFVRDLEDKDLMSTTLKTTGRSFKHLSAAAGQNAHVRSYLWIGDKAPSEFADWFKEEFHKPPKGGPEDGLSYHLQLAGSSEELELLGIVMFDNSS